MRNHLVTRFRCTDCGEFLNLSYDLPEGAMRREPRRDEVVTGASKVEQVVYIEPCAGCVGKAREPLRKMKEALAAMTA